jgi:Domain of unknown function (DUF4337)
MPGAHESAHRAEHAEHVAASNRKIALLIAVLALFLAFSETLGKSAQTDALNSNVEASNLWAFFQAKTIRMTAVRTAADAAQIELASTGDPAIKAEKQKQIEAWRKDAARYDSEPETQEGRRELSARAKKAEQKSALNMAKYHHYELASAAFQVGIVLASSAVITGIMTLSYIAGALGLAGLAFMAVGLFAPTAVHLF